ncbi:MAG: sulfatase-like hydrolase/transferase [Cyclobacteriaceae bacterium]
MNHIKITFYKDIRVQIFVLLVVLAGCSAKQAETTQQKPNVLFIFADDQMFESIGALEGCPVKTPNLDRLVDQGVLFSHAYNMGSFSAAVCVASRTMLNSGAFLWKAASYSPKANHRDKNSPGSTKGYHIEPQKPEGFWSQFMKEAGYKTYMTGKWHVPGVNAAELFDTVMHVRPGMPNQTKERYARTFDPNEEDTWSPYDTSKGGFWKGGKHWSEIVGDNAITFIEDAKTTDDPFFAYVAFNAPHDPRQSPKKYVDMYPLEDIAVPESFLPEYPYNEYAGAGRTLRDEKLAPFPRTEYSIQVNRQEYYAIITHMDEQIGRILNALEASGKADNTYIFFTADHGLAIGDHGFVGKQNMYESSMRVPLMVVGPKIPNQKVVDEFVYLQDVMATALDLAGSEKAQQVDFNSLMPLATGQTKKSNYPTVYGAYFGSQRMYRTKDYKMIIYPTANMVRLYDMKNDPKEINDLAGDKEKHADLLKKLFEEYQQLQKQMNDPVDITESFDNFMNGMPAPSLAAMN